MSTTDKATDFPFGANVSNEEQPDLPFDDPTSQEPEKPAEAPQGASEALKAQEDAQEASKPRKGPQKPRKQRSRKQPGVGFFLLVTAQADPDNPDDKPKTERVNLSSTTVKAARAEMRKIIDKDPERFFGSGVGLLHQIETHVIEKRVTARIR